MRETYFSICKCRLCGETYANGQTRCTKTELAILICENGKELHVHTCKDGALGIADLQGFRLQKE